MPRFAMAFSLTACLFAAGCNDTRHEGGTEAEQIREEQLDVKQAMENLDDAKENVAEQKKDVKKAKENVIKQENQLEEAQDAVGDAARQVEKEKADLAAEKTDPEEFVDPQPE